MPPKTKAPKIRWRGGGSRVDEELDAVDYADNYGYDDEDVPKAAPKPAPKPAPKVEEKPKPAAPKAPTPKPEVYYEEFGKANEIKKQESDILEKEIVLETFDDWETAMDALDKKMSEEEEARAKQRKPNK